MAPPSYCDAPKREREENELLVRGSMGHHIQVVHLWRLRLIVTRLKEREQKIVLVKGSR